VAADYALEVGAGEVACIRLRLSTKADTASFSQEFDQLIDQKRREADEFYRTIIPSGTSEDAAHVMR
jgi:hypothetical protein